MQQPNASPLYNYISSGMFKSFYWKGPLLVSSLPAEALDTFPAHWIINLLPLCLHPILDNPPCMEKEGDSISCPCPQALAFSVLVTHTHWHICPWVSYNNKGSVTASSTHLLNTYTLTKQLHKTSHFMWGSSHSDWNVSHNVNRILAKV